MELVPSKLEFKDVWQSVALEADPGSVVEEFGVVSFNVHLLVNSSESIAVSLCDFCPSSIPAQAFIVEDYLTKTRKTVLNHKIIK